jgi:hypothetical protein
VLCTGTLQWLLFTHRYEQFSVDPDITSKLNDGWLSGDRLEECAYLKKAFTIASL